MKLSKINRHIKNNDINLGVIFGVYSVIVTLTNPLGNFPLNDDWAYGYSVKVLLETGDFQLSGWTATNLITQVFWGALFCLPLGFSFTALRFSTLVLGLCGVLATYGILREADTSPKLSLLGCILIAINPLYFALSNTFLNDVQFAGIALISLYCLVRGLKYNSRVMIGIGLLFSFLAILSRQVGLAIPLAFCCTYLGKVYWSKNKFSLLTLIKAISPVILGFLLQISYQKWLQLTLRLPDKFGNQIKTLVWELRQGFSHSFSNFTLITLFSLIYLGLFIFPLLILKYWQQLQGMSKRAKFSSLVFTSGFSVAVMGYLMSQNRLMPLFGNILVDFGIGPIILKNVDPSNPAPAPRWLWFGITVVGVIGAALLVQYLWWTLLLILAPGFNSEKKWITVLITTTGCIYFAPISLLGFGPFGFYDRYLVFLVPLLVLTVLITASSSYSKHSPPNYLQVISLMMVGLYGIFTLGATHDYLSLNRGRWEALNNLTTEQKVSPDQIDGGFEFNGWYLYDPDYQYDSTSKKSWYWVNEDNYVVTLTPIPGFSILKSDLIEQVLTSPKPILVLQKNYVLSKESHE